MLLDENFMEYTEGQPLPMQDLGKVTEGNETVVLREPADFVFTYLRDGRLDRTCPVLLFLRYLASPPSSRMFAGLS